MAFLIGLIFGLAAGTVISFIIVGKMYDEDLRNIREDMLEEYGAKEDNEKEDEEECRINSTSE